MARRKRMKRERRRAEGGKYQNWSSIGDDHGMLDGIHEGLAKRHLLYARHVETIDLIPDCKQKKKEKKEMST